MEGTINKTKNHENDIRALPLDIPIESMSNKESEIKTSIKMEGDQLDEDTKEFVNEVNENSVPVKNLQLIDIPSENSSHEESELQTSVKSEGNQSDDKLASGCKTQSEATPEPSHSRFEVDVNQIETVTVEDQDADIQSLGLTVYDQSALERGIWDQVERESRKREAQQELANVSTKLKLAEEQLKRVEASKGIKRSILQSALEEPARKKPNKAALKNHQVITQEKVEELRLKQAKLKAQLSNKVQAKNDEVEEESERDRKIRMGEMTPFGTVANASSSNLNSFAKYLQSQQELHKKMISSGTVKRKSTSKSTQGQISEKYSLPSTHHKTSPGKKILKKNILFPKKSRPKEKLGSTVSELEEDQGRPPGDTAAEAETAVIDLNESGSEYVPSGTDDDFDPQDESPEKKRSGSSKKEKPSPASKKGAMSDRWAGGSLKRRRKTVRTLPDGDADDWKSDDSDWICTDDEFSSDNESGKNSKRSSKRAKDDGNSEEYFRRVKLWEKQNDGLRDQLEADVHEFDNGYKIPNQIWDKIYTYQQVGVRWMWELNQQKCGGILGDEMGLGKTIQIISYLAGLHISKLKCRTTGYRGLGPTLIVCPTTVMHQWVREFHTWYAPLRVAILHDSGSYCGQRSQLIRDMLHEKGVMITSYTAVVRLQKYLLHQRWHYVILDEGHKIRNPDAQVTLALKQMRTPHRIILSGSPLQNNLRELWSLMDFVFPGKLGTLPVFMSEFAVPISQGGYSNASEVMVATAFKCATVLRDTIAPYLLRRMKADVSDHIKLPSKNEQVLFCRLTDEQRDLYKEYLKCGEVGRILEGRCQIFVGLINLRKICNHPHLYSGGPKLFAEEKEEDISVEERFGYWEKAGKMVVIEALLKMWHKQEHRVLIFTQSRQMLLIMEKFVSDKGYKYLKLDGGTSIAARQPLITKFNEDKTFFVMLLTTRVGGLGVNLTGANRVVIYDPDWNPATDTQARERAWRIGQKNAVTVYRLITAGTIEEKMYHRQIFKQFLCNKVLKDPRQRRFFQSSDLLDLFTLKETDDATTETSAIFAGTNSQVHVKPKKDSKKSPRDKRISHSSSHHPHSHPRDSSLHSHQSHKSKHEKSRACSESSSSKVEKTDKISFSQDKLDHMKRLAHELSLKLSNKVSAPPKEKQIVDEEKEPLQVLNIINASNSTEKINEGDELDEAKNEPVGKPNDTDASEDAVVCTNSNVKECGEHLMEAGPLEEAIMAEDSDDDLEGMKQIAQELSKELLKKVKTAAALNIPKISEVNGVGKSNPQSDRDLKDNDFTENSVSLSLSTENTIKSIDASQGPEINSVKVTISSNEASASSQSICKYSQQTHHNSKLKDLNEGSTSSRHKKSKKHKKSKHKDVVFEGERVRGLVKASVLEEKTKEEIAEQASHNSKQDDYVLRKLFAKTGIKTAMQHDKVMQSGDADYALVEGEARRVAQEAVKAMKASRQQCWNPMSGQATWTGSSGAIRIPQGGENRPQPSRPKFGKKKTPLKKSSTLTSNDADAEEEVGSGSLLERIRARNLLLNDEDDDPNPTGPPQSVSDSNKELLDDIRTFVSFGASVDGRATTDEIITQFRDRLPPQSSALFKQMLMQICEFHRLPSGQGVWKLIPDFRW